jgi:hypothetical protein
LPAPDAPLQPDTVTASAPSAPAEETRKTWGYTYAELQRRHPAETLQDLRGEPVDDPSSARSYTCTRARRLNGPRLEPRELSRAARRSLAR